MGAGISNASSAQCSRQFQTADFGVDGYLDFKGATSDWTPSVTVVGILPNADANVNAVVTTIRGCLWDDPTDQVKDFVVALNVAHPLRFRRITANGTSCTSFVMLGQ